MAPSQSELTLEDLQRLQDSSSPGAIRSPKVYFQELHSQFRRAVEAGPKPMVRHFRIGPFRAKFHFASQELAEALTPPFAHLETAPAQAYDICVGFWDSRRSGVALNPPRWTEIQGSRLGLHGDGHHIQYDFGTEVLNAFRAEDGLGLFWVKDAREIFFSEKVCPARSIFHWLSEDNALQLIHGGAVGDRQGGAILVGRGGAGKSTSCTAALKSDLFFLGDDYCLVDTGKSPKVYSLYASTKVNPDMVGRFPHLAACRMPATGVPDEKPSFLIHDSFKDRLLRELPLKAILMPRVTGRPETRVLPAGAMQGLHALAPSTLFQSTGLGGSSLKKMAELSRRVPCFFLEPGTDLDGIPVAIGNLLKTL